MKLSKFRSLKLLSGFILILVILVGILLFTPKSDEVKLLYATNGDNYDSAAYANFQQNLLANLRLERRALHGLSARDLGKYDAVYLDPGIRQEADWQLDASILMKYVHNGGHLLLENSFAASFPPDFLGAKQIVRISPGGGEAPPANSASSAEAGISYPAVAYNLQSLQQVFQLFTDSYFKHNTLNDLPGFDWGYGLVPSSAQAVVSRNDLALCAVNQSGRGTVLLSSAFLPNRYFATGYDMASGADPAQGFSEFAAKYKAESKPTPGAAYFNKRDLPLEQPYFNFAFAAANMQFRTEMLAYVSKEKLGYSAKKVLGPYGRPAMAFQNHFEAMPAIQQKDGIAWAELLKKYNEVPSFTLVRSSFYWGQWRESLTAQLNTGTNEQPAFVGELPGSGYASGLHVMAGGVPLRQALFPQYRDLASAIELPYRAYPAAADLNGDGRTDLLAGSADGFVYVYTNQGQNPAAYASEPLPEGLALPDTFGAAEKLKLASGRPLQLKPYTTVHAADVNGDGRADLVVSDESGAVLVLPQQAGGSFGEPAAMRAGGRPLQLPGGAAAVAVADMDGDGKLDLAAGDAAGRVYLYKGGSAASLELGAGSELLRLPDGRTHAAPAVRDMNGDGRPDLLVGSNEGDLLVYLQGADGSWSLQGPLEGATLNQIGSHALIAGHYSTALWVDLNHDGKDDLIVGGVEFGSPVPIDNPQFPYQAELKQFIEYAKDQHLQLNPHVFVHNYKSAEQEQQEIALQKQAFDRLGIPWSHPGTNQHTWRVSNTERQQTVRSEQEQGMWYNFGFLPSKSPVLSRPESIWSLPFLLQGEPSGGKPFLIHTPTPVLRQGDYATTDIFDSMVKLDMPIDYFEHIEYHFPIPAKIADLTEFADYFDKLRAAHDYNFMSETQMAQSFLAAMEGKVRISRSWGMYAWDKLKDILKGGNPHWHATVTPLTNDVSELAGEYAGALGIVIDKGERFVQYNLDTDSDLYTSQGTRFYVGLNKPVSVGIQPDADRLHLIRSNVPMDVASDNGTYRLQLKAAGLQQIKLYSPYELSFHADDAKVEHDAQAHTYTITRYGDLTEFTFTKAQ